MRELSLHILDIARNSIEAGATALQITVAEQPATDTLELTVRDNGRGMDEDTARRATDAFFTTRETRKVGLGLPLLRATCERCGGTLEVRSRPGEGTEVHGTMRLTHVDRPPLGDMGKVVQALALEADRTSLRYRHQTPARRFELDTHELRKELGGVPVTDPRVLCWLAEFVKNGIVSTGSKA
jgi:anti-sigma regulatory factor (Ser/Thr protein kinase)